MALKRTRMLCKGSKKNQLRSLPSDMSGQLDILRHDCDAFGVNGAQVSVFEQSDEVRLRCLLQCQDCPTGKVYSSLKVLGNLPHQPLEREPPYQQLSRFLVSADFTEGHSTRPVPVWLLGCCWLCHTPLSWWLSPSRQQFMRIQPCHIGGRWHLRDLTFMLSADC